MPDAQLEVAALLERLAGGPPLETHISAVFRGRDTVWKLKKAVKLAFLDFTRPEERRRLLLRELALNQDWAPGLYRDVVGVARTADGLALVEGGAGADADAVDWVLRMARAPDGDFLDRAAAGGRLDGPALDAVADAVAAMHAGLAPVRVQDPAARMHQVAAGNAEAALRAGLPQAEVRPWLAAMEAALGRRQEQLVQREAAGLVRRAHGDLHLGNLVFWGGRPVPFDALEFDEALATIDLGYDLAFLLMDLDCSLGRPAANRVMNRYAARTGDAGLVGVLPPFLSLRAMVRAHVCATKGEARAAAYLAAARAYLSPPRQALVLAVGGLMGTGKTTLGRALAPGMGAAPGALLLRSDELRKRLHGVAPEEKLPDAAYGPAANQRTDAALLAAVRMAAGQGHSVVVDATFLSPGLAEQVAAEAAAAGAGFLGAWLQTGLAELERRVAARRGDASDATVAVLRAAAARAVPPAGWLQVDAADAGSAQAMVQNALGLL